VNNGLAFAPPAWPLRKLKFTANIRTSNVDKVKNDDELPVHLCNYVDVYYNDRITHDLAFMEGTATPEEINRFALREGQVIITKDSESWDDIAVPALVTEDMANVLCGYHLAIFDPDRTKLDGTFLAWLCRSDTLNDQFKLAANGVTRFGLGQYPMRNAVLALPPLETQKRIAAFLDEKTARIDALIARKQALLGHLAEKRQALITRAVTKGLNPAAPLKNSGIDWLGQIPAHWVVMPIKRIKRFLTSGSRGWGDYYADEGDMFLRMTNVTKGGVEIDTTDLRFVNLEGVNEGTRTATQVGDILITITAELGSVAIVREAHVGAYINQHLALFRCDQSRCDPNYLVSFLSSEVTKAQFQLSGQGGTKQGLGFDQVDGVMIGLPPLDEQIQIAQHVEITQAEINKIELEVSNLIARLTEFRAALITSAVTGQLEGLQ
jgi:type I restriction enzyme, S subunit